MPLGLGSSLTEERLETENTLFLAEWAKGGGRGRFWLLSLLEEVVTAAEEIRLESLQTLTKHLSCTLFYPNRLSRIFMRRIETSRIFQSHIFLSYVLLDPKYLSRICFVMPD